MPAPPSEPDSDSAPDIDLLPATPTIHPPLVPEQPSASASPSPSPSAALLPLPLPLLLTSEESRNLITANFTHFRDDPFSFLREISLHYTGTGWRAYDAPIGQKVFYKGFSEEMKTAVLRSAMLTAKLRDLAEKRVRVEDELGVFGRDGAAKRARRKAEVERQLQEVTDKIVDGMICKFESKSFIRVCLGEFFLCFVLFYVHVRCLFTLLGIVALSIRDLGVLPLSAELEGGEGYI